MSRFMVNRFAGTCEECHQPVEAGKGVAILLPSVRMCSARWVVVHQQACVGCEANLTTRARRWAENTFAGRPAEERAWVAHLPDLENPDFPACATWTKSRWNVTVIGRTMGETSDQRTCRNCLRVYRKEFPEVA